jgi:hypothetical protein
MTNNHPLLGIFFNHPLHPVCRSMRAIAFFGSLTFGLTITNIIYMAFVLQHRPFDQKLVQLSVIDQEITGDQIIDKALSEVTVTSGMVALWTVGSALNALYDNLIWSLAGCSCCLEGSRYEHLQKYRKYIPLFTVFLVMGTAAFASLIVLIVAASNANSSDLHTAKLFGLKYNTNRESYRFLLSYSLEVLLSLALWYPFVGALLFSGILGCFNLSILGGRPYEIKELEKIKSLEDPDEEGHEVTMIDNRNVHLEDVI